MPINTKFIPLTVGENIMTVCFIGHRTIENAEQIKVKLFSLLSKLISDCADIFLFGSRSDFDSLCWEVVTELKE